ncbi:MAG: class I SAM-dependent methyltransferase [Pseudomonadota bacterium]
MSDGQCDFLLFYDRGRLSLQQNGRGAAGPLCVDFEDGALAYRQRHSTQPEAILKALGAKHGESLRIVDATAGWGLDAFVLASAGHRVELCERSVVLHALLQDGLRRASASMDDWVVAAAGRMTLQLGDSSQLLSEREDMPDVIYLDPMFPERRKSAKVKKNMFLLQQLLQDDRPSETLLHDALPMARRRIVVKRPLHAGFLENLKPSFQLTGKSSRFDIYLARTTGGA